jgi:toxin ParE1/3/4
MDVASRLVDSITDRFFLLASFPHVRRVRDQDFGVGMRSFAVGEFIIVYSTDEDDVLILRVMHGRRDLERLFDQ